MLLLHKAIDNLILVLKKKNAPQLYPPNWTPAVIRGMESYSYKLDNSRKEVYVAFAESPV